MHRVVASGVLLAIVLGVGSCGESPDPTGPLPGQPGTNPPTEPPGGPPPGPASIVSLQLLHPVALLVHESALLTVIGRTAAGDTTSLPSVPSYVSSDPTIASVSTEGVVQAHRRGIVTIGARLGALSVDASIVVRARVKIEPDLALAGGSAWPLSVGETIQFSVSLVDVNGLLVEAAPTATWSSSNPDAVSVDGQGLVLGSRPLQSAVITASTLDGVASTNVMVNDVIAGQPAMVRFAHAALGVGPITFTPSRGEPVTLTYGQSVDRPVGSGTLFVETAGLPPGNVQYASNSRFAGVIRGGDKLSLYAIGGITQASLSRVWTTSASVPPDSGWVRLVQGWSSYGVVYVRPTGAAADGLPELCYFDPLDSSPYYPRGAGPFDLIFRTKYGEPSVVRVATSAPAGHAVTLVIAGDTPATLTVVPFPDF